MLKDEKVGKYNKIIKEAAGVSFEVREWVDIIYPLLQNLGANEPRLIVDGQDYPEQYQKFGVDYFVIDFNTWTNGYLDETSGYDADGNYVVHIMVLEQFRSHPYMKTILNHEVKHAYQDWQRRSKGHQGIFATKEVKDVYTGDFIKVVKDRIKVGNFFKEILKKYYLLTDLELNAFMENVYDKDMINDYKRMVSNLTDYDAYRSTYYEDPRDLEKDWQTLLSADIPFLKKYKDYKSFLIASTKYFRERSKEILRKIDKLEYVHRDRNINEENNFDWVNEIGFSKPEQFLFNKFMECRLEKMGSKNWVGHTKYIGKDGKILFVDNINTGTQSPILYFDDDEIYLKLKEMGLTYEEMQRLCIDMLYETHKRKVFTTYINSR